MPTFERTWLNDFDLDYNPVKSLQINYSLNSNRDMRFKQKMLTLFSSNANINTPELFGVGVGREVLKTQVLTNSFSPRILSFLDTRLRYSTTYNEDKRAELQIYEGHNIKNVRNNTTWAANLDFNFIQLSHFFDKKKNEPEEIKDKKIDNSIENDQKQNDISPDTDVTNKEKYEPLHYSPSWFLSNWESLIKNIKPLTVSFTKDIKKDNKYLEETPSFFYMFGLEGISELKRLRSSDDEAINNNFETSSGVSFSKDIGITGTYNYSKKTRQYQSSLTYENLITWPKLSLTVGSVEKIKLFKGLVTSSSIRSGFLKESGESGNMIIGAFDEKTDKYQWEPLISWQTYWNNSINTTITYSKHQLKIERTGSESEANNWNLNGQLSYTLRTKKGLSLKLIGSSQKIFRFESDIDISLNIQISSEKKVNLLKSAWQMNIEKNLLIYSITPALKYTFSKNIDGGLEFTFKDKNNKITAIKSREIGITIWTMFKF
jgi:hypothetical protein